MADLFFRMAREGLRSSHPPPTDAHCFQDRAGCALLGQSTVVEGPESHSPPPLSLSKTEPIEGAEGLAGMA